MTAQLTLSASVFVLLGVASVISARLRRCAVGVRHPALVEEISVRINSWWVIAAVFLSALALGTSAMLVLFFFISLRCCRELGEVTSSGSRATVVLLACQYGLLATGSTELAIVFLPLAAFLLRARLREEAFSLLVFAYLLSFAPGLLALAIPGSLEELRRELLFFLVFVTESSDILQFIGGKTFGRTPILPRLSPRKTVEGIVTGIVGSAAIGALLAPFVAVSRGDAAVLGALLCVAGFFGGAVMSAIKRGAGVKDFGTLIPGHGGMVDRLDSLCFSAPAFFFLLWAMEG